MKELFERMAKGPVVLTRSAARAMLGEKVSLGLLADGVLTPTAPRAAHPCDDDLSRCDRDVVPSDEEGCPYLALCRGMSDEPCPALQLSEDEVHQVQVSAVALHDLLRGLFGVTKPEHGRQGEIAPLGHTATGAGVYFVRNPRARAMGDAARSVPEGGLVLVPTTEGAALDALETASRRGVRVVSLAESVSFGPDGLALAGRRRARSPKVSAPAAVLPKAQSFRDVRITLLDGHSVRISVRGTAVRCHFVDLGLGSRHSGKPLRAFDILVAICEGNGTFRISQFGKFDAVRKQLQILEKALAQVVGCEDEAFEAYVPKVGWKPRFWARAKD